MAISLIQQEDASRSHHDREFGFWMYLMSDAIIFALLFATYLIMADSTAGGPSAHDLFRLPHALIESVVLLVSSATFGLASVELNLGQARRVVACLALTFALGFIFLAMEVSEFHDLVVRGVSPDRSGFLSAFFTLVGVHGLHVGFGMLWIVIFGVQILIRGVNASTASRVSRLALFWHFLDVVWVGVFSIVYLAGIL
jgi:cytochrome o ubiquinol oxidase subunit 3